MKMRMSVIVFVWMGCFCGARAQSDRAVSSFEAASVKMDSGPPTAEVRVGVHGGPGTSDPTRISYRYLSLEFLVYLAYDVPFSQIAGPDWIKTQRYDIEATLPPGTSKSQVKMMLRQLLAERFGLTVRREDREASVFVLKLAASGLKLHKSAIQPATDIPPVESTMRNEYGFTPASPEAGMGGNPQIIKFYGTNRLVVRNESLRAFAGLLAMELRRPVVDATGLQGEYDIELYYMDNSLPPPGMEGIGKNNPYKLAPSISNGIERQLGLTLKEDRSPIEFLVVSHAERTPTPN